MLDQIIFTGRQLPMKNTLARIWSCFCPKFRQNNSLSLLVSFVNVCLNEAPLVRRFSIRNVEPID